MKNRRISKRNTLIVVLCLLIIGSIVVPYSIQGKNISIDLLGIIVVLFSVILALLDNARIKVLKFLNIIKIGGKNER